MSSVVELAIPAGNPSLSPCGDDRSSWISLSMSTESGCDTSGEVEYDWDGSPVVDEDPLSQFPMFSLSRRSSCDNLPLGPSADESLGGVTGRELGKGVDGRLECEGPAMEGVSAGVIGRTS